jgi:uncharacterized caspase-like protein
MKSRLFLYLAAIAILPLNLFSQSPVVNNPFERSWTRASTGKGLAFMDAPGGTLIAYSTSPGKTASDGSGNNSPYTSAILQSIVIPDITIIEMSQNVRSIVSQKSGKQQIPWESTSLTGNFYFNSEKADVPANKTYIYADIGFGLFFPMK